MNDRLKTKLYVFCKNINRPTFGIVDVLFFKVQSIKRNVGSVVGYLIYDWRANITLLNARYFDSSLS